MPNLSETANVKGEKETVPGHWHGAAFQNFDDPFSRAEDRRTQRNESKYEQLCVLSVHCARKKYITVFMQAGTEHLVKTEKYENKVTFSKKATL
jgi:hypothetical protein